MAPPEKTAELLDEMIEHVHYEGSQLALFGHNGNGWLSGVAGVDPRLTWLATQAMLEAALVHLRNLVEFLYTGPQGDRVGAADYVSGWEPAGQAPWKDYGQIQARMAHIGLDRA